MRGLAVFGVVLVWLFNLALIGVLLWVAAHFIAKFW